MPECDGLKNINHVKAKDENSDNDDSDSECPDFGPIQDEDDRVYDANTEMGSFIPSKINSKCQNKIISDEVLGNSHAEWVIGDQPYNEFTTDSLASLAFPTLFPDGKADPTNAATIRTVSKSDTEIFAEKLKHLIKFAEKINGKWYYRFASHPRFAFWGYNMLYRKRLLLQGNFYVKQNPGDLAYTIDELKEMIENNSVNSVMKKLTYYAKNVAGTNSYWHEAKENLKAIINQMGTPTIFWTLSCAEFHWPEYHSLFSSLKSATSELFRMNIESSVFCTSVKMSYILEIPPLIKTLYLFSQMRKFDDFFWLITLLPLSPLG